MEVEVIGRVRHKNLVRLLGYCVEGAYRYLYYIFIAELKAVAFAVFVELNENSSV